MLSSPRIKREMKCRRRKFGANSRSRACSSLGIRALTSAIHFKNFRYTSYGAGICKKPTVCRNNFSVNSFLSLFFPLLFFLFCFSLWNRLQISAQGFQLNDNNGCHLESFKKSNVLRLRMKQGTPKISMTIARVQAGRNRDFKSQIHLHWLYAIHNIEATLIHFRSTNSVTRWWILRILFHDPHGLVRRAWCWGKLSLAIVSGEPLRIREPQKRKSFHAGLGIDFKFLFIFLEGSILHLSKV